MGLRVKKRIKVAIATLYGYVDYVFGEDYGRTKRKRALEK
jgi:hypothetical protein